MFTSGLFTAELSFELNELSRFAFDKFFSNGNNELPILAGGILLLLFISRVLKGLGGQRESSGLHSFFSKKESFAIESSSTKFGFVRLQSVIKGLFVLIVASTTLIKLGVTQPDYVVNLYVAAISIILILSWSILVIVSSRKGINLKRLSFYAVILSSVAILLPVLLVIRWGQPDEFIYICPILLVVGLGIPQWSFAEILSLLVAIIIPGVELLLVLGLPFGYVIALIGISLFAAGLSQYLRVKALATWLFESFLRTSREKESEQNIYLYVADYLATLLRGKQTIVCLGESEVYGVCNGRYVELPTIVHEIERKKDRTRLTGFDEFSGENLSTFSLKFKDDKIKSIIFEDGWLFLFNSNSKENFIFIELKPRLFSFLTKQQFNLTKMIISYAQALYETRNIQNSLSKLEVSLENRLVEQESELNNLVHDINNTVQDLTVMCDVVVERLQSLPIKIGDNVEETEKITDYVEKVSQLASSIALVVSDAKRKRELEHYNDLKPRETVNLEKALMPIVEFAEIRAERRDIKVKFLDARLSSNSLVKVSVKEHLEAIIRNLLSNAIAYSGPETTVDVILKDSEERIQVLIEDQGEGLLEEELEAIFELGYRGKRGLLVKGGLGLGLPHSRRIAEAAGGSLRAEIRKPEKGSRFILELPFVVDERKEEVRPWALLVDDQLNLTDFYAKLIGALGLVPITANTLDKAINAVKDSGKPVLVVTDIQLGNSSGLELIRFLRDEYGLQIPILVVSGLQDATVELQVKEAGGTDFLAKPVSRQVLFARIKSILPADYMEEQ